MYSRRLYGETMALKATVAGGSLVMVLLAAAPAAEAARKSECCYRVLSQTTGQQTADFGNAPAAKINGTEAYTWEFTNRQIIEYVEQDGDPSLARPVSRRRQPAPAVTEGSYRETNNLTQRRGDGSREGEPCRFERSNGRIHFGPGDAVQFEDGVDTSLETQALFPGRSQLLRVVSPELHVGPVCGGSVHGPPTFEAENSSPDKNPTAGQFHWEQFVVPPSRSRLRNGAKHKRFTTGYTLAGNLPANAHGCVPGGCQAHTMSGTLAVKVTFSWFPRSKLAGEVAKLRAYAASDDES